MPPDFSSKNCFVSCAHSLVLVDDIFTSDSTSLAVVAHVRSYVYVPFSSAENTLTQFSSCRYRSANPQNKYIHDP